MSPNVMNLTVGAKLKLLIVDDHPMLAEALSDSIKRRHPSLKVLPIATNVKEAQTLAKQHAPDVILSDIGLPLPEDGLALFSQLKRQNQRVLAFSGHKTYAFDAICAGAQGFIPKDARLDRLLEIIFSVAAGDIIIDETAVPAFTKKLRGAVGGREPVKVTRREMDVLLEIDREGVNPRTLARHLELSEKTIRGYLTRLKNKFGVKDAGELVGAASWAGVFDEQ